MIGIDKGKLIDQAQKYVQKGQIDKAITEYQKLVEADPKDSRIWLKIGELHLKKGNKSVAISDYSKAAEFYSGEGFNLQAIAVYKQLLKIDPSISDIYIKLADLYRRQGLIADAFAQYRIVISNYDKEGKVKEAISALKQMASMDPENFSIRTKLAGLSFKNGNRKEALEEYSNIADDLKKSGRFEDVVALYEKLLSADHSCLEAHRELGAAYLRLGRKKDAVTSLHDAIKLNPEDLKALSLLAEAYIGLDDEQRAKLTYADMLKIDPSSDDAGKGMSKILINEGNQEEGINVILPVIDNALDNSRYDEALAILLGFYSNGIIQPPILERLANVYRLRGETDKEIEFRNELSQFQNAGREINKANEEVEESDKPEALLDELQEVSIEEPPLNTNIIQFDENEAGREVEDISKHLTEAEVYVKYGIKDKAIESLETALRISPGNKEALTMLNSLQEERPEEIMSEPEDIPLEEEFPEEIEVPEIEEITELDIEAEIPTEATTEIPEEPAAEMISYETPEELSEETLEHLPEEIVEETYEEVREEKPEGPSEELFEGRAEEVSEETREELAEEAAVETGGERLEEAAEEMHEEGPPAVSEDIQEERPDEVAESTPAEASLHAEEEIYPLSKVKDYLEEADFYIKQGLYDDAKGVCKRILEEYPENNDTINKLKEIDKEIEAHNQVLEPLPEESDGEGFFDLAAELEGEDFEALTMPPGMREAEKFGFEDIFSEFKQGVESQLEKEDSETHYNLGMAYKEMGLLDDAIREFKIAAADPVREFDSYNLIGICILEKGNPKKAIEVFREALELPDRSNDEYAGMNYELGMAYEQCGMIVDALAAYTEANNYIPGFRDAEGKIAALGGGRQVKKAKVSYI